MDDRRPTSLSSKRRVTTPRDLVMKRATQLVGPLEEHLVQNNLEPMLLKITSFPNSKIKQTKLWWETRTNQSFKPRMTQQKSKITASVPKTPPVISHPLVTKTRNWSSKCLTAWFKISQREFWISVRTPTIWVAHLALRLTLEVEDICSPRDLNLLMVMHRIITSTIRATIIWTISLIRCHIRTTWALVEDHKEGEASVKRTMAWSWVRFLVNSVEFKLIRTIQVEPLLSHCQAVFKCKVTRETSSKVRKAFQTTRTFNHREEVKVAIRTTMLINFISNKCFSRCTSNLATTLLEAKALEAAPLLQTQGLDLLMVINTATRTTPMNSFLKARRSSMLHLPARRANRPSEAPWCLKELKLRILAWTKVLLRSLNKAATIYEKEYQ